MEVREVAVIGLGTMGAGIAEVFARGGLRVTGIEADPQALSRGLEILDSSLSRAVARGKLTAQEQVETFGRIRPATAVADAATADLVIEAVPERMDFKVPIFAELDQVCRPDAILATNTSSLSVTAVAAATKHPGRVIGMHFFNPAPVMRLVEVVTTVLGEPAVAQTVTGLARSLGKTPVQVSDRAGFVANALLLPYLNHAVRLLQTGYASREDIDLAATRGIGLPMGPLTLADLIGLDTCLSVMEVLAAELGGSRYTPAPLLRRMVQAGQTGRKAGRGFYDYAGGSAPAPTSDQEGNAGQPLVPGTVTLIEAGAPEHAADLASAIAAGGISVTRNPAHPSDLTVVAVGPEGGMLGPALRAGRAADAVGAYLPAPGLVELVTTTSTGRPATERAVSMAAHLGLAHVVCADRPGLLTGALLYPHLRDAVAMVDDGYASGADVDTAMKLGCGYPRGPMELLASVGPARALSVLRAMHQGFGDPAFAPPPLLAELAATAQAG